MVYTGFDNLDLREPGVQARVLLDNLPGFPDNLTKGAHGRYWLGLTKPRSALADRMASWPFLRAASLRLPHFLLPVPEAYGHAIAFTEQGVVLNDIQDPSGRFPEVTGITEASGRLYVHSLVAPALGILAWPGAGQAP